MTSNSSWRIVGSSAIGELHKLNNIPNQDSCGYQFTNSDCIIAAVSDGAGSARNSDKGSDWLVKNSIQYFKELINSNYSSPHALPWSSLEWEKICFEFYEKTFEKLRAFSHQENIDIKSLAATLILLIKSNQKIFVLHIGDGRAGYRDDKGEWYPLITPFRGEEANSTIFFTSEFNSLQDFLRTKVIESNISAFCLLTDGLEKICFEVNVFNNISGMYEDPNKPYKKFLDPCIDQLCKLFIQDISQEMIENLWGQFLSEGTELIKNEPDDKTLILAFDLNHFIH